MNDIRGPFLGVRPIITVYTVDVAVLPNFAGSRTEWLKTEPKLWSPLSQVAHASGTRCLITLAIRGCHSVLLCWALPPQAYPTVDVAVISLQTNQKAVGGADVDVALARLAETSEVA